MQEKIKDDTISRKAAIDALRMDISIIPFAKAREYVREAIETIYNRLEELPSAQQEIIHCRDCKWCEDADGLMCKNTASWVVATDYDFGCILAERRQDE